MQFDFVYVVKKHKSAIAVKFLLLNLSTTTTTYICKEHKKGIEWCIQFIGKSII